MMPLVDNITTNFVEIAENPAHLFYTVIVVDSKGNKSPF